MDYVQIDDAFGTRYTPQVDETPPPPPPIPPIQPTYPDSVPVLPVVGSQPASTSLGPYQPPSTVQTTISPPPMVAVPQLVSPGDQIQGFSEPGYFAMLGMKRKDVQKLVILSLMVTLGIAIHWTTVNYYDGWLTTWGLSSRQEFLLRASYPLAVLFVMWNIKAFGVSRSD